MYKTLFCASEYDGVENSPGIGEGICEEVFMETGSKAMKPLTVLGFPFSD